MTFSREEEVFPSANVALASAMEEFNGNGETVESNHGNKRKVQEKQTEKDKQAEKKVLFSFHTIRR